MISRDEAAFLRQLLDQPDEVVGRLVFADWLEEAGQSRRAEFIRLSIRAEAEPDDPDAPAWAEAAQQLLRDHWAEVTRLPDSWPPPERYAFRLGLPESVELTEREALAWGAVVYGAFPVPRLRLGWLSYLFTQPLAEEPWLKGVRHLHFPAGGVRSSMLAVLLGSPHLTGLEALELRNIADAGVICSALAGQARLLRLRRIDLSHSGLHVFAARALCQCPSLAGVETLDLSGNPITDTAALALTRCRYFDALRRLDLSGSMHLSKPMRKRLRRHFGDRVVL